MATPPTDAEDQKAGGQPAGTDGKPIPETHGTSAKLDGKGALSAAARVMKAYTFRCSNKSDLVAISLRPTGDNLPGNICTGQWVWLNEAELERGGHIVGFVSRDLFRDLDRQGFHIASGVRVEVSGPTAAVTTAVSGAISTANTRTRFFPTDTDA
jgi:hypothetical protein